MKKINWDMDKNTLLKQNRDITFEEVCFYIEHNYYLDVIIHPNSEKYPNQKIFILEIGEYIYAVPFVENEEEIYLKTIFPSRKLTKKYKGDTNYES